ncbi:MAG: TonB-dependent receptor domain-containing protein, partial [Spongiibacteraceae bacterium]
GYALSEALKFIISYGEGFNAPTFNDLYYPFYGVATLEPETSTNKEISLQATRSWGEWRISHFRNDVDKLIQYNPATYGPDQIDAAKMNGVEVSVSTTVNNWHIDSNLTRLQARDKNTGKDLPRRPDTQFNIDIGRQWQKWGAGASLRVVSRRFDDPANNDALAGYGLLDSSLSYQFNKVVKLQLAVKNLLDKHYVSARSFSLGNYQSTGREAQLSITITP